MVRDVGSAVSEAPRRRVAMGPTANPSTARATSGRPTTNTVIQDEPGVGFAARPMPIGPSGDIITATSAAMCCEPLQMQLPGVARRDTITRFVIPIAARTSPSCHWERVCREHRLPDEHERRDCHDDPHDTETDCLEADGIDDGLLAVAGSHRTSVELQFAVGPLLADSTDDVVVRRARRRSDRQADAVDGDVAVNRIPPCRCGGELPCRPRSIPRRDVQPGRRGGARCR